jgi:ligand-binding sensor domain-containing protein/signal transduction histidine kinase
MNTPNTKATIKYQRVALVLVFATQLLLCRESVGQEWTLYSTADGLAENAIWHIQEDQRGLLWFVTGFSGATSYDGVRFETVNTTTGLASNNIYSVVADSRGNIWFGTDRGISRYDGKEFQNSDTSNGLAGNTVIFILEDTSGKMWFATDVGVSRYDDHGFMGFDESDGIADNNVTFILEDRDHRIWLGTADGVCRFDGERFQNWSNDGVLGFVQVLFEDSNGNLWIGAEKGVFRKSVDKAGIVGPLEAASVTSVVEDRAGNLWFLTTDEGVLKYETRRTAFVKQSDSISGEILCMFEDRRGNLWFGTNKGIVKYDGRNYLVLEEIDESPVRFVRHIMEDSDENIWYGSEDGVVKYTMENFHFFTVDTGLTTNIVNDIAQDKDGNMWFGTENGAVKFDGDDLQVFGVRDGLPDRNVLALFRDSKSNLWFGTASGLTCNLESSETKTFRLNTAVRAIDEDSRGNIWIATTEGISKYDEKVTESFPVENGLEVLIDSNNNVWIGSWDAGLRRLGDQEEPEQFTLENGLASNHVTWIMETTSGDYWFGLRAGLSEGSGGACLFDGANFQNLSTADGLPSDLITAATEDSAGAIWFVSARGAVKCDDYSRSDTLRFQKISEAHGLISNYITSILVDRTGNIWFGTDKGVSKYDGEIFQNINLEQHITLGGDVKTIFEDNNGTMWFVTTNDGVINYVSPASEIRPRVHLTKVEGDRIYSRFDNIRMSSTAERVTFEYKGISFKTKPDRLRYAYTLEGFDSDWRPSTVDNRVHYEDLPPGDYRFKVKAIDKDLHYSDPPATATIRIYEPFFLTLPFQILGFLAGIGLLAGAGYLGVQLRTQRRITMHFKDKLRRQEEAERIQSAKMESLRQLIAGVAHEINNPVGAIASSKDVCDRAITKITDLLNKEFHGNIKEHKQLTKTLDILGSTNRASQLAFDKISNIVANLRRFVRLDEAEWQVTDIHAGIDSAIAVLEPKFDDRIRIKRTYGVVPEIYCSPSSLNQVFLEIIENAFEAIDDDGEVAIRTFRDGSSVVIEISDTGKGIEESDVNRVFDPGFTHKGVQVGVGLGLSICYKIITDQHKGRIDVSSAPRKGTTFVVALPCERNER